MPIAKLDRNIIRISGKAADDWLNGLISNSISNSINFAALLTPQGKIIADFFVMPADGALLLDVPVKFSEILIKRLKLYKLRAPIEIETTDQNVYAAWDGIGEEGCQDPRHPLLGRRIIADMIETTAMSADYNQHRLSLGIPDSQWDFETSELFPANANMDLLSGVDFKKGCFIGQEVVSRMHRKTEIRKRLRGINFSGEILEMDIKHGDRIVGTILYHQVGLGMAMIRHDRLPNDVASVPGALKAGSTNIGLLELPHGNTA
ncbi:MAG: folate-binding protein [Hellea sp.]|nr:folate-binding protein [Hellea sp.]